MHQPDQPQLFHIGTNNEDSMGDSNGSPGSSTKIDNEPASVKPVKSRDRARHREVEQKYRNRINSKMDELCTLLTPDGKPQMQKYTALDNAIRQIKNLRRENEMLRNECSHWRAHAYTLQCLVNRSMGVEMAPAVDNNWKSVAVQQGNSPPSSADGMLVALIMFYLFL